MSTNLVLASSSPARSQLLDSAHIAYTQQSSAVDEDKIIHDKHLSDPGQIALTLAQAKAFDVTSRIKDNNSHHETSFVLGCDSVFEIDRKTYGKPHKPEIAQQRITNMQGKSGTLHTGHSLIKIDDNNNIEERSGLSSTVVTFDHLSPEEIQAYVKSGEPLEVAGSFTLDGLGSCFIKSINGSASNVIGLDINTLRNLLADFNFKITNFWTV